MQKREEETDHLSDSLEDWFGGAWDDFEEWSEASEPPEETVIQLLRQLYQVSETVIDCTGMEALLQEAMQTASSAEEQAIVVQMKQVIQNLSEEGSRLEAVPKATVGIGGKFSSGKSAFINTFFFSESDEYIVPEGQNPTTAVSTYVAQGEKEQFLMERLDRQRSAFPVERSQDMTHEVLNQVGLRARSFVRYFYYDDPQFPYDRLSIVDTPGYSKADYDRSSGASDYETALHDLSRVDYLIWLIDIENGELQQDDISFLQQMPQEQRKCLLITKADKKAPSNRQAVLEQVKKTAAMQGLALEDVLLYSADSPDEEIQPSIDRLQAIMSDWNDRPIETNMQRLTTLYQQWLTLVVDETQRLFQEEERLKRVIGDISPLRVTPFLRLLTDTVRARKNSQRRFQALADWGMNTLDVSSLEWSDQERDRAIADYLTRGGSPDRLNETVRENRSISKQTGE